MDAPVKVLHVEDDPAARLHVARGLERRGIVVEGAGRVSTGLQRSLRGRYDALILDVRLPDGSGLDLVRELRHAGCDTPVLFLSARGKAHERIEGLKLGADDYLSKPFAMDELAARLHIIVRRHAGAAPGCLRVADLVFDPIAGTVERAGRRIDLPPKPLALLELLIRNAGRVVERDTIVERVWGGEREPRSNAVAVQMNTLRSLIDRGFEPKLIHTRPGLGYVLEVRSI